MQTSTLNNVLFFFLLLGMVILVWQVVDMNDKVYTVCEEECSVCSDVIQYGEKAALFNASMVKRANAVGLAFGDSGYCVWTKDRTPCEIADNDPSLGWLRHQCINETALHEMFHVLIAQSHTNWKHFCEVKEDGIRS